MALLLLLLPTLSHAIDAPTSSVSLNGVALRRVKRPRFTTSNNNFNFDDDHNCCFLTLSSSTTQQCYKSNNNNTNNNKRSIISSSTITASLVSSDYFNNKDYDTTTTATCYVPPYGMVPRKGTSIVMMNMMPNDGGGIGYTTDDRFRKKMASNRVKVRCLLLSSHMGGGGS